MKRFPRTTIAGTFRGRLTLPLRFVLLLELGYCGIASAQQVAETTETAATAETAQVESSKAAPESAGTNLRDHLAVYLELSDTELGVAEVHAALEQEFKIPVVAVKTPSGLQLRVTGTQLSASFEGDNGAHVEREMQLPEEKAQQLVTISLLSGSIARDETGALLARLRAPAPELPAEEEAVPEAEEAVPPDEPPTATTTSAAAQPPEEEQKGLETEDDDETSARAALPEVFASASFSGNISYPRQLSQKKTHLHLGVVSSDIGSLSGVAATLLVHRNRGLGKQGAGSGAQLAVAFLHTGGDFKGVGGAALVGSGSGKLEGLLAAGLFSLQRGDLQGAQLSGLVSAGHGNVQGIQLGGLGAFQLGNLRGVQGGGLSSFTRGDLVGYQWSALASGSGGHVKGAQIAALGTYAHQGVSGYQMGLINVARNQLDGMQLGLVNVAGDFDGTQVGLVNVGGRGKGTQVALINVAKDLKGAAIAPVNIIPGIRNQLLAYFSYFPSKRLEGTPRGPLLHVGVKFLPGTVYSQIALGFGFESQECPSASEPSGTITEGSCYGHGIVYAPSFAVGARSKFNQSFHMDIDGQYQFVRGFNSSRSAIHQILGRVALGVELSKKVGLLAGSGPRLDFYEGPRVDSPPDLSFGWHAFSGVTFF